MGLEERQERSSKAFGVGEPGAATRLLVVNVQHFDVRSAAAQKTGRAVKREYVAWKINLLN
jgi:hypothetical protein